MLLVDPLADVFDLSRVSGAVMAQLIAYEPWGLAVDPVPGAVFHAMVAGSCWLRMPGRAPQHLMPGDDGGVAATLSLLALELGGRPPGSRAAVGRLIDVILIHMMRAWLRMQEDDATDGWLLALRDPVVARAMTAIHQRPREPWTTESLAREVSVSRATLARRFAHLLGETPPEYLTRWRMDLAAQRLRDTDDTVGAIAAAVGYRSEYSFSRAFTRHRGLAPGRYRRHARERALAAP